MTPEQIRRNKCQRTKARNAAYKAEQAERLAKRQQAYDKLSPTEKIAKLDKQLGKGVGAVKQRSKLAKQAEKAAA